MTGDKAGSLDTRFDWAAALTNAAMMGVQPSELRAMTWWEYQALLWNWNDRHDPDGAKEPAPAPDGDMVALQMEALVKRGLVRMH